MELMPGYKRSSSGVIPEDWKSTAIATLVEQTSPICYGVVQVGQYTEGGVPIVAIKYVKEISYAPLHRTAPNLEQPYTRSRVKGGDVLISIKGTIGRVGIVPKGFEGNISRELARLRISNGTCAEYVAHQLEANTTQDRIMRSVVGTTRLEFSIAVLRQFEIPIPPTEIEQQAISKVLNDVDDLLEGLSCLIAKKSDLKQAAMQQLLTGTTRLPGFNGEWEEKSLGEIATISKGTQLKSSETDPDGQIPHYNGGMNPSSFTVRFNTPANTIAISEGGNSCGFVQFIAEPFWCGGHCYAVSPKSIANDFLFHALKSQQNSIMGLRVGSGLPNVQKTALGLFKLKFPKDSSEQVAIASVLSDMDAEISDLEIRRKKTRVLKQAMMEELLTGKTRLIAKGEIHV